MAASSGTRFTWAGTGKETEEMMIALARRAVAVGISALALVGMAAGPAAVPPSQG